MLDRQIYRPGAALYHEDAKAKGLSSPQTACQPPSVRMENTSPHTTTTNTSELSSSFARQANEVNRRSTPDVKVALFRSLFRGRDDVYPRRFVSRKTGKAGYAPACGNPP
ncbi:MAG TPA: hypothetical protein VMR25_26850, partial [Planctomycetaceae bacterium]|nr:hypothetical protein [Planctomycetaceae bacterium]